MRLFLCGGSSDRIYLVVTVVPLRAETLDDTALPGRVPALDHDHCRSFSHDMGDEDSLQTLLKLLQILRVAAVVAVARFEIREVDNAADQA